MIYLIKKIDLIEIYIPLVMDQSLDLILIVWSVNELLPSYHSLMQIIEI
jgi:hypothetical protein